jgi:hypothetical protein
MSVQRLIVVASCMLALSVGSAGAHSVPQLWWLDEATALKQVTALEKTRWRPAAYKGSTGSCHGLAPTARRAGHAVYKHFSCTLKVHITTVTFTFYSRVHVVGPRGRVVQGG